MSLTNHLTYRQQMSGQAAKERHDKDEQEAAVSGERDARP
jgi:hypothetical protein